jgi:hypothetical protein
VDLTDYRESFPILAETTYLISHSLGPMPAEAARRLAEYAHAWNTRGVRAWGEGWWELPVTVGDQIARLIGAPPGSTVMHQNVTIAEAVVLSCFDLRGERRRIVYEEENFPSVRYLQQAQGRRRGRRAGTGKMSRRSTSGAPSRSATSSSRRARDVEPIIERAYDARTSPTPTSRRLGPARRGALSVDSRSAERQRLAAARERVGSTSVRTSPRRSSRRSSAGRRTQDPSASSPSSSTRRARGAS